MQAVWQAQENLPHLWRPLKLESCQAGWQVSSRAMREASSAGDTKLGMVWCPGSPEWPPAVSLRSSICLHSMSH